ncbi:MAG TPA: altronate dehydratase family protein [Lentisphaeria bacterium]|nr:altronate dehydratase family protein [Lentisphaeria bacterium]
MMRHIQITHQDNVAIALQDLAAGEAIAGLKLRDAIPRGHKFAISAIPVGGLVIKYGLPIGSASAAIAPGEHVHSHNLKTRLSGIVEYHYDGPPAPVALPDFPEAFFQGYRRTDGQVGIRNHLFIVPTVGCINKLAEGLAAAFNRQKPATAAAIDRAIALTHPYGCSQLGDDHETTRAILAAHVRHPNAAGVLVLGLGCENNTVESFRELVGAGDPQRRRFLVAQEEDDDFAVGLQALHDLAAAAANDRREPIPASELVIGLKCGGSDGLSGITANPLLGRFSDQLVALGGTSLLGEVPEMFGAEQLLMQRCETAEVFQKCVAMINDFKNYFTRHGQVIYENPSPGNKTGGISTLEDKSLGCTQKGGSTNVVDVLGAGETPSRRGLNLLSGPGNDMVATTLLSAAGAHLVLFTTGRGTPFGGVVPTLKIATNTELARRKPHWIDFDAGRVLEEHADRDAIDQTFFQLVLDTASGQVARNEIHGHEEIAIFKDGVTL